MQSIKINGLASLERNLRKLVEDLPQMRRETNERLSEQVFAEEAQAIPWKGDGPPSENWREYSASLKNWYALALDSYNQAGSKLEKAAIEETNQLADQIQKSLKK